MEGTIGHQKNQATNPLTQSFMMVRMAKFQASILWIWRPGCSRQPGWSSGCYPPGTKVSDFAPVFSVDGGGLTG